MKVQLTQVKGPIAPLRPWVRYEFVDAKGRAWGEPGEITIRRDFSFSESQALAKEREERQLIRDMQLDAAAQVLRRLQAVKRPG